MVERWFSTIKLPMTLEQFHALPRNPAYKHEYIDGRAWLTPRPKMYHALLDLHPLDAPAVVDAQEPVAIRPLVPDDWEHLPGAFAAAFHRVQPFASLDEDRRLVAASQCLGYTRGGRDGPVIAPACFVAEAGAGDPPLGAILITLLSDADLTDLRANIRWKNPPPDCIERRLGRPHLTWIFVGPWHSGHGVGTALLAASVRELLALGYRELASTFLLGNESSTLWHWRNGFRLLAHPGSWRLMRERWRDTPDPEA